MFPFSDSLSRTGLRPVDQESLFAVDGQQPC